ncbi:M15 family metallopeptidase [Nesterenkonia alkaliphila]|uniref:D-alanyl-D-alanine carboxypeptidase family protein n=1 Tax=Nesterenkonia alkaliphila TaxID=1463631 RepID=A0A7K1UHZ9_9MICC|nr:M15 family metallopeptidase [Nesterenkonia alkaliphila]MVT26095.1 D-alanyl-D-alanine carboxypeptidase family protein [Nesterenkonia alkaliphila]GFZ79285.1 hypothetical protein GCM10011359_04710 [Nesterenkonia alkaliphila]
MRSISHSLLSAAMTAVLLTGCGGSDPGEDSAGAGTSPATASADAVSAPETVEPESEPPAAEHEAEPGGEEEAPETPVSEASWEPDSVHVLVNKRNPLDPLSYSPSDLVTPNVPLHGPQEAMQLRAEPAEALERLFAAADGAGHSLSMISGYRSHDYQVQVYGQHVATNGQEAADRVSARPGHSEHQTGLAVDVDTPAGPETTLRRAFGETPEGRWVAENAHEFGFIIRYPEGAEEITGFSYEPWHLRYVGEATAAEIVARGVTLEEYWDQPAAPDYQD